MRKYPFVFVAGSCLFFLAVALQADEGTSIEWSPLWEEGDAYTCVMTRKTEKSVAPQTGSGSSAQAPPKTTTVEVSCDIDIQVMEKQGDSFQVAWTYGPMRGLEKLDPGTRKLMDPFAGVRMVIQTDTSGKPEDIANFPEIQRVFMQTVKGLDSLKDGASKADARELQQRQKRNALFTPELIKASCLKEPSFLFAFCDISTTIGEVQEMESVLPSPFGGDPLPAKITHTLESVDKEAHTATYTARQEIDLQGIGSALKAINQETNPELSAADQAKVLEALADGEITDIMRYTIDTAKGWPIALEHVRTARFKGVNENVATTFVCKPKGENRRKNADEKKIAARKSPGRESKSSGAGKEPVEKKIVEWSPNWQPGDKFRYVMKIKLDRHMEYKEDQGPRKLDLAEETMEVPFTVEVVRKSQDAYMLVWINEKPKFDSFANASSELVKEMNVTPGMRIVFTTNERGRPRAITNLNDVRKKFMATAEAYYKTRKGMQGNDREAVQRRYQVLAAMAPPEKVQAVCLREPYFFFSGCVGQFVVGETRTVDDEVYNPWGGEPFPAKTSITLKTFDEAADSVIIECTVKTVKSGLERLLREVVYHDRTLSDEEVKTMLRSTELSDQYHYKIDLKTGWPMAVKHIRTFRRPFGKDVRTILFVQRKAVETTK